LTLAARSADTHRLTSTNVRLIDDDGRPDQLGAERVSAASRGRVLTASDVFVGFLCLYALSATRSPPLSDAVPMWQAAADLVRHGSFASDARWPVNAPPGVGGHYYPVAALLACLVHVPGALLHVALSALAPARAPELAVMTSQLRPLVLGA